MILSYLITIIFIYIALYVIYTFINEGICNVLKLYFIAFTGYKYRYDKFGNKYKYPNFILALKRLNYKFSKYYLYRLLS